MLRIISKFNENILLQKNHPVKRYLNENPNNAIKNTKGLITANYVLF